MWIKYEFFLYRCAKKIEFSLNIRHDSNNWETADIKLIDFIQLEWLPFSEIYWTKEDEELRKRVEREWQWKKCEVREKKKYCLRTMFKTIGPKWIQVILVNTIRISVEIMFIILFVFDCLKITLSSSRFSSKN